MLSRQQLLTNLRTAVLAAALYVGQIAQVNSNEGFSLLSHEERHETVKNLSALLSLGYPRPALIDARAAGNVVLNRSSADNFTKTKDGFSASHGYFDRETVSRVSKAISSRGFDEANRNASFPVKDTGSPGNFSCIG